MCYNINMNIYYWNKYLLLCRYWQHNNNLITKFSKEKHHIYPKCLGGSDEASNLVEVPTKVHLLLHYWLYKALPLQKTACAYHFMSNTRGNKSLGYQTKARESYISNHPAKKNPPMKGKNHTQETKLKISRAKMNSTATASTRKKLSEAAWKFHGKRDLTVRTWVKEGVVERLTRSQLKNKYNLNSGGLTMLIRGDAKQYKGWTLKQL